MTRISNMLPITVTAALVVATLIYGPISQLPNYHEFANQALLFGIPHFADVASNLGFLLVALWGLFYLAPARHHPALANGWSGYRLFLVGLLLTAFGSAYYHLAPDNARLVWDRLPIALACGGLIAGAWGDAHRRPSGSLAAALAVAAVASVAWWRFTDLSGTDDLRLYLLLQVLPFLLIPLWLSLHDHGKYDPWFFGAALVLYAAAKWAELYDHEIGAAIGLTGHTLKHLLATLASAAIVAALHLRIAAGPQAIAVGCAQQQ